jgi:hypothetical protein
MNEFLHDLNIMIKTGELPNDDRYIINRLVDMWFDSDMVLYKRSLEFFNGKNHLKESIHKNLSRDEIIMLTDSCKGAIGLPSHKFYITLNKLLEI